MGRTIDVYESARDESVSTAVIRALAAATDTDPVDMDVRLYDAVDPDALDAIYESPGGPDSAPRVSFTVEEYHVTVDESRDVRVTTDRGSAPETPARTDLNPLTSAGHAKQIAFDT